MTTPTSDVAALQAAIEAGPTPGEWQTHSGYLVRRCEGDYCAPIAEMRSPYRHGVGIVRGHKEEWANLHFIAAASPDRITRVLAALRAAEQRADLLQGALERADRLAATERNRARAAEADAARYRWLRLNRPYVVRVQSESIHCGGHLPIKPEKYGPALDAAIDALKQGEQPS